MIAKSNYLETCQEKIVYCNQTCTGLKNLDELFQLLLLKCEKISTLLMKYDPFDEIESIIYSAREIPF